jgi:type IV secretory pathway VirB2 component (pilin)
MRFIPTWIHGLLDYPLSILLIALPWLGGFATGGIAQWVPIVAGVAMLGLSATTAYEAGLVRSIPMTAHLATDAVLGILLAASPWLFGFADLVWMPFVVLGIGEFGAAMTTETRPGHRLSRTAF